MIRRVVPSESVETYRLLEEAAAQMSMTITALNKALRANRNTGLDVVVERLVSDALIFGAAIVGVQSFFVETREADGVDPSMFKS